MGAEGAEGAGGRDGSGSGSGREREGMGGAAHGPRIGGIVGGALGRW